VGSFPKALEEALSSITALESEGVRLNNVINDKQQELLVCYHPFFVLYVLSHSTALLQAQLAAMNSFRAETEQQIRQLSSSLSEYKTNFSSLTAAFESLQQDNKSEKETNCQLNERIHHLSAEIQSLTEKQQQLLAQIEYLQQSVIAKLTQEKQALMEESVQLQANLASQQQQTADFTAKYQSVCQEFAQTRDSMTQQYGALQDQHKETVGLLAQTRQQLENKQEESEKHLAAAHSWQGKEEERSAELKQARELMSQMQQAWEQGRLALHFLLLFLFIFRFLSD
jgi:chromosome segregation ATPase